MQQPVDERYKLSLLYPAVNGCTEVSSCCICSIAHCKGMACARFPQLPALRQSKTQLNSQLFNCPFYVSSTSAALAICMVQDTGGQSIGPNCTGTYRLQGVRCLLYWLWGLTSLHPQARSLFAPLSLCDGRTPPVRQMWAWGVLHCKDINRSQIVWDHAVACCLHKYFLADASCTSWNPHCSCSCVANQFTSVCWLLQASTSTCDHCNANAIQCVLY